MDVPTFRSNPVMVARMREIISDPVFATAIVAVENDLPPSDAMDGADALVSVRLLSRQFQHKQTVLTLLSLGEPMPPESPEESEKWGVDTSQFKSETPP